jgi:predicted TIM-barrel fold metal-dependent hydrolase
MAMSDLSDVALDLDDTRRCENPTLLPEPVAEELWCPVISVDDHVLEPGDLFTSRVSPKFASAVPHQVVTEDLVPYWEIEDERYPITPTNGASGRPKREWNSAPQRYEEFRPAVWDSKLRLHDMDLTGVWAQLGFPSVVFGFAGSRLSRIKDSKVGLSAVQAYNDWMLDEWCAADRNRFIPCQVPWMRDPRQAAAEIYRNADRGFRAVSFSENPEALGFGSIHGEYWDPFFAACQETNTVVNLHVGSSGFVIKPSDDSPHEVVSALFPVNAIIAVVDWIFAKVPIRFPKIQLALSEGGVTWVPMVAERLRRSYRGLDVTKRWTAEDPEPVELLHRNFWFTSIEDPIGFRMLGDIGEDRVMVETDYPHFDSTWPRSQEMVRGELDGLSPDVIQKVCFRNAAALYRHPEPPSGWIEGSIVGAKSTVLDRPL